MSRARRLRWVAGAVALAVVLAACTAKPNDYTGDRKADFVYVRGNDWLRFGEPTPLFTQLATDLPVPGDYGGSGRWHPAVLRGRDWISPDLAEPIHFDPPGLPTGPPAYPTWTDGVTFYPINGLAPVPADYDGTGKTLPAYYSLVDATWWLQGHAPVQFGVAPRADGAIDWDIPVPADYDGDGKADIAVFRPSDSTFHVLPSAGGAELVLPTGAVSRPTVPAPGDYDGDGRTDAAATTLGGDQWYRNGSTAPFATFPLDTTVVDVPAPADYDGDGRTDPALVHTVNGIPPATTGSAALDVAGQGTSVVPVAQGYVSATLPPILEMSMLELVFYDHCLHYDSWHTYHPDHCPGP